MQRTEMCELGFVQFLILAAMPWFILRESGKDLMLLGFDISGLKLWHKLPEHSMLFGPVS